MLQQFLRWYNSHLQANALRTKMISAFVVVGSGVVVSGVVVVDGRVVVVDARAGDERGGEQEQQGKAHGGTSGRPRYR